MPRDILIFLPTYNEAGNLERLVGDLERRYPDADLLIADDNSPDGTGGIADRLARARPERVRVIHRPAKMGLGSAHVLGMDHALAEGYRTLVTMDCDYTHRPEDVRTLIAILRANPYDLVIGSRYQHPDGIADWPLARRIVTRTAHFMTRALLGIDYDATNAFRAYDTAALRRVNYRAIRSDGYSFMFEMVFACVRAGLRVGEAPVQLPIRQAGKSKISHLEIGRAVGALLRLSTTRLARWGAGAGTGGRPA